MVLSLMAAVEDILIGDHNSAFVGNRDLTKLSILFELNE